MTEPVSEPPPTGSDVNNNPASQPEGQVVVVEPEQDPAETRPSKTSWRQKLCTAESILTFATIGGVLLGGIIGILINSYAESGFPSHAVTPRTASWIKLPGTLFLRALKMIILPLIMSSMINAITHLPPKAAGKIGAFALAFYMFTTIIAVMLGLVLSVVIKPGIGTDKTHLAGGRKGSLPCVARMYPTDTVYDLLHNFVPDNLVEMTFKSASSCANMEIFNPKTKKLRSFHPEEYKGFMEALDDKEKMAQLTDEDKEIAKNMDKNILGTLITVKKNSMNILGLVLVSVCIGVTIIKVGRAAEPLKNFFVSVEAVSMAITTAIIWFSPIGIMCLVAHAVMIMKDPANDFRKLGLYMATVITGLLIHGLIVLPLLYLAIVRKNPLIYMKNMLPAYATAFGTASSSATMPVSMRCLEEVNKVKRSIVTFVVPLGATVNMDGTALYEAAAAIYILQAVRGEMPTFGECLLTSITATLASIGAAGIPSAGLVTMLMVLIAIGVDESYVGLVLPVDWLLDRIRTTVNVHGDAIGAGVVQKLCLMFKVEGLDNEHNTTAGENGPLALPPPPPPPDAPGADQSRPPPVAAGTSPPAAQAASPVKSSSAVGAGGDAVAVPPARVALATTSPLRSRRSNRGVPPETPEAPEASTQLSNSSRDDSK